MSKLSVVIITYNEEKNIGRCIDSVLSVADEIVVLDSFSNDRTVQIARQKGALVYQQGFEGYYQQKNKALQLASHDHILSLDADEALSYALATAIEQEKSNLGETAFQMKRCNIYCGKPIRHGLWYPDKKIRLFNRTSAGFGGLNPHDTVILKRNTPVKNLKGDLLHYTCNSAEEYARRNDEISSIAARSLFESGKKTHWTKLILSPAWTFINGYILKKGFLNGVTGWRIAVLTTRQSFHKYNKLRHLRQQPDEKITFHHMQTDYSA